MSIVGILASNFYSANGTQDNTDAAQSTQSNQSKPQQIKAEFQQLGQDLQSGNLAQAQTDYATLSQNFPGASQSTAAAAAAAAAATTGAATTPAATATGATTSASSAAQAFAQLGQDLQAGNLQAAQQDFTNLQQGLQQNASQQVGGQHHHHHHAESSQASTTTTSGSSTPQTNPINVTFGTLGQDLQAGNLAGAQAAFATLQSDLQQIGGFATTAASSGTSSTATTATAGTLNVSA
jgi:outer membrane protein assembly factor BamD (BamD/ComL family)